MKRIYWVMGIILVICISAVWVGAERSPAFWPDDIQPPFGTVNSSSDPGVIILPVAEFDPLKTQPVLPAPLKLDEKQVPDYLIVQFNGPVTETQKDAIQNQGITLLRYVPHFTFIARNDKGKNVSSIKATENVRWIGAFHPAYRILPTVGTIELTQPERVNDPRYTLDVKLFRDESIPELTAILKSLGGEIQETVDNEIRKSVIVRLDPAKIPELARYQPIYRIYERGEYYLLNDETQEVIQSGSPSLGTPVWDNGIHGEGQYITIMDSGLDPDHCFFYDSVEGLPGVLPNYDHRKVIMYRVYGGGGTYDECVGGHGTHVSGTAAGYTTNTSGDDYIGVAYEAKISFQDIDDDCSLSIYPPTSLYSALNTSYNIDSFIHSNSWGGSTNEYDSYAEECDDFMWENPDFLILFAAGNDGPGSGTVGYPATAKNIVAVGGCKNYPNTNDMYYYSSRGPVASSNRMAPTLTAPATDSYTGIDSANSDGGTTGETCGITDMSGTSMACPAVAGAAALVRQYYVDGYYPTGSATPGDSITPSAALIKATLINSTVNMSSPTNRPSNDQGWGRLQLDETLFFPGDDASMYVEDNDTGVSTGDDEIYTVNVSSNSEPLMVSLVWTDRSGNYLVNDLDLEVNHASSTWYGNNFSSGWSNTSTSRDRSHPMECVFLQPGTYSTGTYTITVSGYNVPQGSSGYQPFALVVSGALSSEPTSTPTSTEVPEDTPTPTPSPTGPTMTPTASCDDIDMFVMDNLGSSPYTNFEVLCNPAISSVPNGVSFWVGTDICPNDCAVSDDYHFGWIYEDEPDSTAWHYYVTPPLTLDCTKDLMADMCYGMDGYPDAQQGDFYIYWRCADSTVTTGCTQMTNSGPTGDWQLAWSDTGTDWTVDCTSRTINGQSVAIPCSCDSVEVMVAVNWSTWADEYSLAYFRLYYNLCDPQCSAGERNCPDYSPTPIPSSTPVPSETPTPEPTDTQTPVPSETPVPSATAEPSVTATPTPSSVIPTTGPVGLGVLMILVGVLMMSGIHRRRKDE